MDHFRGNFLIISLLRKSRRIKGEFSMWIFPPLFPRESPRIFPHGNFPHISFKMSKRHYKDIQRVPVVKKYPSNVLMSILWWTEISFSFPPGISREFKGVILYGNFQTVSLQLLTNDIMLIKAPVCHPANFICDIREDPGFWYVFSQLWKYNGFLRFRGCQVDASPKFHPFLSPCARSDPFLYEQHIFG